MDPSRTSGPLRRALPLAALALAAPFAVAAAATAATPSAAARTGLVRVVYSIPDGPSVDVYLAGRRVAKALGRGQVAPYVTLPRGTATYALRRAGSSRGSAPILSGTTPVLAGKAVTLVGSGFLRKDNVKGRTYVKREPTTKPTDVTRVRVFPLSPDAPTFDVYLGTTKGKPFDAGRGYPMTNGYRKTEAGKATFVLTLHGSRKALLKLRDRTLVDGEPATLYVFGAYGPQSGEERLTLRLVSDALPVSTARRAAR
jgi:Domain of unknown function (DUF4397)